ncbi:LLM class flavin-dependent oxidoreductase [Paractinoplanes atraurantiacus]|uniref:Flavin-dependent oxidoreductase, luciferase family (Includes alkanesulfonate monooxygenase SsuD and methylene tetrahydromethanopterin reductase) n=1 Tax=Paractinoplanes atraurantiacus TaxID=1036182 RepID=A0A285JXE8_9ACTN|nr:LLM class flavin-dependent oxidoreductase [Actinoplanes atraurantiacus]SNY64723.1 Flavin-dependent oxidoreductase, luciferase family (includes alkanesulfonate monooxygenase SsuD and methylene tetrahydromethanopterin reductase) [Actinoplanes atraurantiacus]
MTHVGVMLPRDLPANQVLAYARRAEQLGFDELWVVEDLGFRGGVAQAGAVLAATDHIMVGIGILPAGARNAAFTAMELATLAQLFPGRLIAGIGHGMPDWMRSVGAWPASPLTLLREYTTAVRTLLRGEPGPAAGRYVDVEGVVIGETPQTVPPVVLGVRGPKSIAVAGQVADGLLLAEPAAPPYIAEAAARLESSSPLVITYDAAAVHDDGDKARDLVRPGLAGIGEPDWAPHLAPLPFAADLAAHRRAAAGPAEFAATMPDAWVRELSLAGTPAEVRAQIAARHAAGAGSVIMIPAEPDPLQALTGLAQALPRPERP